MARADGPGQILALLDRGRTEEALTQARRLASQRPRDAGAAQVLGLCLAGSGQLQEARTVLETATRQHPGHPGLTQALARVLKGLGEADEAAQLLEPLCRRADAAAPIHADRVRALLAAGDTGAAASAAEQALSRWPDDAGLWSLLGRARDAVGDSAGSAEAFGRAAERAPDEPSNHANRAAALLRSGDARASLEAADEALVLRPGHRNASRTRALALQSTGRLEEARGVLAESVAAAPDDGELLYDLGACEQLRGALPEARAAYRACLERMPGHPLAIAGLAAIDELEGDYEAGWERLQGSGSVDTPAGLAVLGRLARRLGRTGEALPRLEGALTATADRSGPAAAERGLRFALADLYDAEGRHAEAARSYRRANALKRAAFDRDRHRREVRNIMAAFPGGQDGGDGGIDDGRPVLIVGMPRSGTSLVEQILAAHPQVHATGESAMLAEAVRSVADETDAHAWAGAEPERIGSAARAYLEELEHEAGDARKITDKMPMNFRLLGAAARMLPGMRVVHCRRDLLDVAWSCFTTDFSDPALGFCYDMNDLASVSADYLRLMAHWRRTLSPPMLELDYEGLVDDLEDSVRRLLRFLDLEWDPACLEFHRLERQVKTASYAQVRRPIYTSSVGRHRPYLEELDPVRRAIADCD